MPQLSGASEYPLAIESVERSPVGSERVIVRLTGRWIGRKRGVDGRPLLVVEADGRHHRFPALPERRARFGRPGSWRARFLVPAWLKPRLEGEMSLWLGSLVIPLPPIPAEHAEPGDTGAAEADSHSNVLPQEGGENAYREGEAAAMDDLTTDRDERAPEAERSADIVGAHATMATNVALQSELQERAAAEAHIRGVLASVQAELEARIATQSRLEGSLGHLRSELDELRGLIEREAAQRAELESTGVALAARVAERQQQLDDVTAARDRLTHELAASTVARDAAKAEAAGLRAEIERLGAELASAREDAVGRSGGLAEAEAMLAEARALTSRLRGPGDGSVSGAPAE